MRRSTTAPTSMQHSATGAGCQGRAIPASGRSSPPVARPYRAGTRRVTSASREGHTEPASPTLLPRPLHGGSETIARMAITASDRGPHSHSEEKAALDQYATTLDWYTTHAWRNKLCFWIAETLILIIAAAIPVTVAFTTDERIAAVLGPVVVVLTGCRTVFVGTRTGGASARPLLASSSNEHSTTRTPATTTARTVIGSSVIASPRSKLLRLLAGCACAARPQTNLRGFLDCPWEKATASASVKAPAGKSLVEGVGG